ncbi:MAG: FAD binding domain-containing protein [Massilia sp.]
MLTWDNYISAASLDDALAQLAQYGERARVIAGGTDLFTWAREGRAGDVHFDAMVDVTKIPQLSGVSLEQGRLRIGANTTIAEFVRHPLLLQHAPVLRRCAVWFADDQIREQATIGGNIVNASPAGDAMPPLMTQDATITSWRLEGGVPVARTLPLSEFITGPTRTALQPGELLGHIEVEPAGAYGTAFEKCGHRRSLVISTICLAVLARLDATRTRFHDVRIAIGAVGPVPERLPDVERLLVGRQVSAELIAAAAQMAEHHVRSRSRVEYRREVLVNFVERGIVNALRECGLAVDRDAERLEVSHA